MAAQQPARTSPELRARLHSARANVGVLGFSMRAIARLFGLGCVWPALGNLTRRKLRGLVEPYGESVKQVLPQLPQDAAVVRCWH